ncbi:MAG: hypothetical protein CVU54_13650 [Deltaproteobacteria bacterium HGW-Deltaproteobacteria-12]|jgi:hypothetical protein|nr:MAG: hypothetical protein CVU54_13650 [Deltaproteobacteria bacterium HGW-Deltaproteobacteria-12]
MDKKISAIWLQVACVIAVATGLVSAAASFPATAGPWLFLFDLLKWPIDGNPSQFDLPTRAVNAVLGGVMVGWGILMFLLVRNFLNNDFALVRRLILISIVAWFVVDSTGSFLAELPGNVLLNVSFLFLFLPPLLLVKNENK